MIFGVSSYLIPLYFTGGIIPLFLLISRLQLLNTRLIILIVSAVSIYNFIICRTFFQGIPSELVDAARIDGCSVFRTFAQIVLPLSMALIGVMALYYGVSHWNSYFYALIFLRDSAKWPLQLFLRQILITEEAASAVGTVVASEQLYEVEKLKQLLKYSVIIVSSLPVLIAYPFIQKYFDKGVMIGSLKA